ncbi:aminotransferase class III-fold pyridoxal phosphate-dependent enzyme, partial [Noviherbaspirillum sp. CPCC 100848]
MTEKITLVFSGIGTQWIGMGASLLAHDAIFRSAVTEIDALLSPLQNWSLLDLLSGREKKVSLDQPEVAHPAIFSIQIGLTRCLLHRGLRPEAVIGHSAGEVAAAVCAGALSLEDAVVLVAAHSRLIAAVTPGAMLHVPLDAETVASRIAQSKTPLEIAAINSDEAVVVAGPPDAISAFDAMLKTDGIDTRLLSIRIPFHTRAVEPHLDDFKARIAGIRPLPGSKAFYSSLRGGLALEGDFSADYWARHIRRTVQFPAAARKMFEDGINRCIEVSPHPALLQHLASIAGIDNQALSFEATLKRGDDEPVWPQTQQASQAQRGAGTGIDMQALKDALEELIADMTGAAWPSDATRAMTWSELGFTSLLITRFMSELSTRLGRPLSVTLPYRYPTPAAMIEGLATPDGNAERHSSRARHDEPVGIVGMACRFPGTADNPDALWDMLVSGTDPVTDIPSERWDADAFYSAERGEKGRSVTRWGSFIASQDLRDFDARHFRMTPKEASALDPQQRLLLEVTWEAIENAGFSVAELKGRQVGVYIGISTDDYKNSTLYHDIESLDPYAGAGTMSCTAAGRLSYFFGWEGPNLAIDTACSGSLVALHLACQALQAGECEIAVVGGVNAMLTPHLFVYFSKAGIMSPTGRCHVFDDSADGYVRAEGCGIIVLQRESDAERAGGRVRARVLGSAVNQDGASSGFSAPNGAAQQKVLRKAWHQAGVTPADIGYLEAHGTGTPIGDPIELEAIVAAVSPQRSPQDRILVGSLKSNLGHLEAAAGVGAVIKTVLALENDRIPANLHFRKPNAHMDWENLPLQVADRNQPFPERGGRHIAGISSFGFSGTNAHAVLERAKPHEAAAVRPVQVLALSAPDSDSLRSLAQTYAQRLGRLDAAGVADLACSTHLSRTHFPSRVTVAAPGHEIAGLLQQWVKEQKAGAQLFTGEGESGPLVFAFTGQGCQHPGMARALYESEPRFREVLDRCEAALISAGHPGMLALVLDANANAALLESTDVAQPAIFAMQCGIVALLASWGIKPDRVVGHSIGEFAASVCSGALELEEALALVVERGRLMASLPPGGAMAAVQVDAETADGAIGEYRERVAIAAINGKRMIVLSGESDALDAVLSRLGAPGARAKKLVVSHAFHSPLMKPAADAFASLTAPASRKARIRWISTLDCSDLSETGVDIGYWARQIVSPVRFSDALDALENEGCRTFIEIGPAAVLTPLGKNRESNLQQTWIATQERHRDGNLSMGGALAALAALGHDVDWSAFDPPAGRRRADLPAYPFQRRRHWRQPVLPGTASPETRDAVVPEISPYAWLNRFALCKLSSLLHDAGLTDAHQVEECWRRHFASCLRLLTDAGFFIERNGRIVQNELPPTMGRSAVHLAEEQKRFLSAHPSLAGCLELLDACLNGYVDILTARLDPMTILFPNGSMERVASVYANNEVQDKFNGHVANVVADLCSALVAGMPERRLRILEIGAGTGASTSAILAALPRHASIDYCFTDISPAFLARARKRFGQLRFERLDIEQHPCRQGFSEGEADLVIANNVLHATSDIGVTLEHVHWLTASGGALVLNEQTELQPFIHLIFGLTDGWWRFTDSVREGASSPVLSHAQWTDALGRAGFDVQPDPFNTDAGQTVFIANVMKKDFEMAAEVHASSTNSTPVPRADAESALREIRAMVAELTGLAQEDIDPDAALIDLGLDSLMLVQMKTLLSEKLALDIDMADFYGDLDSVARLAEVVPVSSAAPATLPPTTPAATVAAARMQAQPSLQLHANPATLPNRPVAAASETMFAAGSAAAVQGDLAKLMSQQLESMSRLISEQNALLAGAPAAFQATAVAVPAAVPSVPAASSTVRTSSEISVPAAKPAGKAGTPNFRSLKLDSDKLTPGQKTFVDELARRYSARTPGSKALADRTRDTLADWKNTLSFRYTLKEMMYPIVAEKSKGSHFIDIDGNDFLDVTMGCGIALLGHAPECVTRAVHAQVDANFAIGPQTALASEVAERFSRITGMERATFCNTGAEAVMMAVRIARAVTGRSKVVIFNGAYHGTWDGVLGVEHKGAVHPIAAGIPQGMVDDLVILNYGTDEALAALRQQAGEIAAVLVEPVQSRRPGFHPADFLRQLRSITEQAGAALIFDEMITGFRILPGGGQAFYGIKADLATYGKIVGGGLPLSVVAGSARFMDVVDGGAWRYGDDSKPESDVIYFGGTYVKHPLALAAAKASLEFIEQTGLQGYQELNARTARLADTINAWFASEAVPLNMSHFGSLFRIDGTGRYSSIMQPVELDLFFLLLNLRSIYVWERRICFLSFAHTDEEVDHLIECMKQAVLELRAAGFEFRSDGSGGKPPSSGGNPQAGGGNAISQNAGPAASAQRRMFALAEIEGPSVVYNVPLAIRLRGALDRSRLEQVLADLAARHPALRTRFAIEGDALVQKVDPVMQLRIEPIEADAAEASQRLDSFVQPFDLKTGPLFRAGLMKLDDSDHILIMDAHHIVVDGLSLNILAQELMAGYGGQPLPKPGASMIDYAMSEAGYLSSDACRRDAEYWKSRFDSLPQPLQLPLDYPRPARRRHRGADLLAKLDSAATSRLKAAARASKMTVFPLLLTLYATLLHRISAQDDLVIGLPVGGRAEPRFRNTVGMLAATLPLRMRSTPNESLAASARACHKSFLEALGHQAYPLEALIASLELPRDTSRNPLFDTMFIYEDGNDRVYRMAGLECAPADVSRHAAMFDLAMEVVEAEGELTMRCEYDVDLFSQAGAQAILDAYVRLLSQAPDMLEQPVNELELVDTQQRERLLSLGSGGPVPVHGTLLQAFDAQLAKDPNATALIADGVAMSYAELNRRANGLAQELHAGGRLPPESTVALMSHRDAGLLVGLLGILRAGAAYVPVDPDFPAERIRQMLEGSGCRCVVASSSLIERIPALPGGRVIDLNGIGELAEANLTPAAITPDSLAYVIFTSGSTGTPKGAML